MCFSTSTSFKWNTSNPPSLSNVPILSPQALLILTIESYSVLTKTVKATCDFVFFKWGHKKHLSIRSHKACIFALLLVHYTRPGQGHHTAINSTELQSHSSPPSRSERGGGGGEGERKWGK